MNVSVPLVAILFTKTRDEGSDLQGLWGLLVGLRRNRRNTRVEAYTTNEKRNEGCMEISACLVARREHNLLVKDMWLL